MHIHSHNKPTIVRIHKYPHTFVLDTIIYYTLISLHTHTHIYTLMPLCTQTHTQPLSYNSHIHFYTQSFTSSHTYTCMRLFRFTHKHTPPLPRTRSCTHIYIKPHLCIHRAAPRNGLRAGELETGNHSAGWSHIAQFPCGSRSSHPSVAGHKLFSRRL